jgi:uncharacterized protein (TIGR00251 family)
MQLHVLAVPNARTSEVVGWEDDPRAGRVLRVKIAAPPVDGKANAALRDFLAERFGLPKSKVCLEKGDTSRIKKFTVPDGSVLKPLACSFTGGVGTLLKNMREKNDSALPAGETVARSRSDGMDVPAIGVGLGAQTPGGGSVGTPNERDEIRWRPDRVVP